MIYYNPLPYYPPINPYNITLQGDIKYYRAFNKKRQAGGPIYGTSLIVCTFRRLRISIMPLPGWSFIYYIDYTGIPSRYLTTIAKPGHVQPSWCKFVTSKSHLEVSSTVVSTMSTPKNFLPVQNHRRTVPQPRDQRQAPSSRYCHYYWWWSQSLSWRQADHAGAQNIWQKIKRLQSGRPYTKGYATGPPW